MQCCIIEACATVCSAADAFVVVWAFCVAGVTFDFSKDLPILGYGVRALQNLYVPTQSDKTKQQNSMVQLIKERCGKTGAMQLLAHSPVCLMVGPCRCRHGLFVGDRPTWRLESQTAQHWFCM
jgi:hypothetical protein